MKVDYNDISDLILNKNIVAMFQGKSEAGPRALGNRSFLYDPRDPEGRDYVNQVKKREWYRPFAGSILVEHANQWFDMRGLLESPYMMYAVKVLDEHVNKIPAILHIDNTCRIQTVSKSQNFHYYNLIESFYKKTNIPILFNTSFNLAGDPLVETLNDAIDTLKKCDVKYLYLPEKEELIFVE